MTYHPSEQRYDSMRYNRSGRSGLKLPAISLGLWHNFGGDSPDQGRGILRRAFDMGITHFDLANNYGPPPGAAETNFGRLLHEDFAKHRDEMIISTKAGYFMWPGPYGEWGSRKYLLASLDQSLKRMGLAYVDIFYSHRPDSETPLEETMGALDDAVRSGRAIYAGISNYGPDDTRTAADILQRLGTPCVIHQPVYNILNRWIEDGLLSVLREEGIGCIAFSPLAQGLLTTRYLGGIPPDSRAARADSFLKASQVTTEHRTLANALNDIARRRGQTLAQLALTWVLRHAGMTSALVGVSSITQLEENVAALANPALTAEEVADIDRVVSATAVP